jgi:hypothetical protein
MVFGCRAASIESPLLVAGILLCSSPGPDDGGSTDAALGVRCVSWPAWRTLTAGLLLAFSGGACGG